MLASQEEGDRKMNVHIQAAATLVLAKYDNLGSDLKSLLRLLCGFKTGDEHKWALKIETHNFATEEQQTLRKVTEAGLFGYCCKQRYTSHVYQCALACVLLL